jgi:N-acyl-D-amino-acid deacylase
MTRHVLTILCVLGLTLAAGVSAQDRTVLIRNGRVMDGSGNPWIYADVLIRGDLIDAIGDLGDVRADEVIDATGLYVTPGFIDTHSTPTPDLPPRG